MKTKKFLALLLAAAMTVGLVACGGDDADKETGKTDDSANVEQSGDAGDDTTPDDTDTPDDKDTPVTPDVEPVDASLDFEDGLFGFIGVNTKVVGGVGNPTFSVEDYAGSKALKATADGKTISVAFQIDALLGDKVADVKTIELSVGIENPTADFYACSGNLYGTYGEDNWKDADPWSVYLETANPKTAKYEVPADAAFGATNNFVVTLEVDNAKDDGVGSTNLYIDNVVFKDANGAKIAADTSATFVVEETGLDPNLLVLKDVVDLGIATSGAGWSQAGITLTEEQKALFVPGSVIEIEYSCTDPLWIVAVGNDANPNPNGNWLRGVEQTGFIPDAYVAADGSKMQFTYETLEGFFGENFGQYIDQFQLEGKADWEVFSVKIGTDSGFTTLGSATDLGIATSGAGWSQAGVTLTEEQKALFVPGSVIEIEYACTDPVWIVAVGNDANPNPNGNWLRGIEQTGFITSGAVNADGTVVQYTYEQLVPFFGENFGQYIDQFQLEGKADFEIYSVKVGKAVKPAKNNVDLGIAVSGAGWSQAGVTLTEEQKALLVPGCVVTVEYACTDPVWIVAVGNDANPNPNGNWLRGIEQTGFITEGAVYAEGTKVQYTYETLAKYFGEGFGPYVDQFQLEGKADFEIYSVKVGMAE